MGWAASHVFSGAPRLGDTAGAHLPAALYCLHFLALVQAGGTWWKKGCWVYFFKIDECFKCEGRDPGYLYCQVRPCISLWGETKVFPLQPHISLQLGPTSVTPMEVYNTLLTHTLDLKYNAHLGPVLHFLHCFFFSKIFTEVQGVHARHIPQGGWGAFTKLSCGFLKQCLSVYHTSSLYPTPSALGYPRWTTSSASGHAQCGTLGFPHRGTVSL